jgi:hypothetical protein
MEAKASIFQTTKEREWVTQMLKAYYNRCTTQEEQEKVTSYFTDALRDLFDNGTWYDRDKAEYVYTICLSSGILKPLDIKALWIRGVFRQLRVLQFCSQESQIPPYYPTLVRQLLVPYFENADIEKILPVFFKLMVKTTKEVTLQDHVIDISGQMWSEVFKAVVGVMDHTSVGFRETEPYLDSVLQENKPPFEDVIRETLVGLLKEKKEALREVIRGRTNTFKEELLALMWHPSRVMAALDAGIELEDL